MAPKSAAAAVANTSQLKRKRDHAPAETTLASNPRSVPSQLDIDGDSEDAGSASGSGSGDDSDAENFPEIDAADDTDDDAASAGDDDEGSDGSYLIEDSDFVDSVDSEEDKNEEDEEENPINTGPKARTVISRITGRPKRVYPEIEPDYDSDSSTEDVCGHHLCHSLSVCLLFVDLLGSQPHRQCANALV